MKQHSVGWHLLMAVVFLAAGAAAWFAGGAVVTSLAPDAEAVRLWVSVFRILATGALVWVGLCHLLQPLIRLIGVHFISVALLVFWGSVLLYFYQSGRVIHYLPDDGLFRPLMLAGGIGMAVLGVFNLLVGRPKGGSCCGHEHDHVHDHAHAHAHDHDHSHGCCGHDHGHEHGHGHEHHQHHGEAPAHAHAHAHDHGHGHEHHEHAHPSRCHGEDLTQPHVHAHDHEHSHGILTSPRWFNQSSAVLVLLAPLALAAAYSPDQFSARAVVNKNLYNPTYGVGARADQFSLRTPDKKDSKLPEKPPFTGSPKVVDMPPPADDSKKVPGSPGPGTTAAIAQMPEKAPGAASTQSYGSFTLADLEAQVPRNKNGNFELNVPEIYYTAGDAEVQKAITGQPIETVAQVLPEKVNNENGHRLRVFRMLVQCCAADARPYSVPVDFGKPAPEFKDMTWVRITGILTFPKEGDQIVPLIEAKSIEETTAPEDAMIY